MPAEFRKGSHAALFLELAEPDELGCSREVFVSEFKGKYESLQFGNGGSWCRSDGRLAKTFQVARRLEKGRIVSVQLLGLQGEHEDDKPPIPAFVYRALKDERCVVLATGQDIQIDHKAGRFDGVHAGRAELSDFQPMSRRVNTAKRQHCIRCKETNDRFDATRLGHAKSQWKGGGKYEGTCEGCYWHDPLLFNRNIGGG